MNEFRFLNDIIFTTVEKHSMTMFCKPTFAGLLLHCTMAEKPQAAEKTMLRQASLTKCGMQYSTVKIFDFNKKRAVHASFFIVGRP